MNLNDIHPCISARLRPTLQPMCSNRGCCFCTGSSYWQPSLDQRKISLAVCHRNDSSALWSRSHTKLGWSVAVMIIDCCVMLPLVFWLCQHSLLMLSAPARWSTPKFLTDSRRKMFCHVNLLLCYPRLLKKMSGELNGDDDLEAFLGNALVALVEMNQTQMKRW